MFRLKSFVRIIIDFTYNIQSYTHAHTHNTYLSLENVFSMLEVVVSSSSESSLSNVKSITSTAID